jgi:hypothetical protein
LILKTQDQQEMQSSCVASVLLMRGFAQLRRDCDIPAPSNGAHMNFSPTIIITTESLVLILLLLRAFQVI